ncbi:MAG: AI-2E family transporter, partial [Candidatus Adiutrix sp.]
MPTSTALRKRAKGTETNRALAVFLILSIALIVGWLLVVLKFIFLPIILAMFATFLLSPPVEWLFKRGIPRPIGIILTISATAVLGWLGLKYISASFVAFHSGFPNYEARIELLLSQARTITNDLPFLSAERIRDALNEISLSGLVGSTLNSFFSVFAYTMVTLLFLLYFLPAFPTLPDKIMQAFPGHRGLTLKKALESISAQVQSYIWAKTLTSIITGAGVALPCLFFGVDFAITWGVFAALLNFVPTIGPILSVIPPVLVAALQPELGGLSTILWLLGILTVVMLVTGNVM